jgi:alkaline phosphatase
MKRPLNYLLFLILLITTSLVNAIASAQQTTTPVVKNIIFLIGDGMGYGQIGLLNAYAKYATHSRYPQRKTELEKAIASSTLGIVYHEAANTLVTDSAASATQIASGIATNVEMIGVDTQGNPVTTILEIAQKKGKATGLVSDTRITHATPAALAAHQTHRSKENEIAVDLLNAQVDIMLSAGLRHWLPQQANEINSVTYQQLQSLIGNEVEIITKRQDERNLLAEARQKGYDLVFNKTQLAQTQGKKILGLFAPFEMPNALEEQRDKDNSHRKIPTLKEMTIKAVETLSKNEQGFFLMIESGQIDWASHSHDAGWLLHEMLKLDDIVGYLTQWMQGREDTLLFITADHDTGGFGFSYSHFQATELKGLLGKILTDQALPKLGLNYGHHQTLDQLFNQKTTYQGLLKQFITLPRQEQTAKKLATLVQENTGVAVTPAELSVVMRSDKDKEHFVYPENASSILLAQVLGKHQNTVWATDTHTSQPVPLIVLGPKSITTQFGQLLHTTEWGQQAIKLLQ